MSDNYGEFRGHLYKWSKDCGYILHWWELRSIHGAIHFHITMVGDDRDPTAGLEFHSVYPRNNQAPDHINCPLTGGRCWHDGTSLYATDTLWPMIRSDLSRGNHEAIFRLLEHEAKKLAEYAPRPFGVPELEEKP